MSGFLLIITSGDTPFLFGETISLNFYTLVFNTYKLINFNLPEILPYIKGISASVPLNSTPLASISFQNTKNILSNISIKQKVDWANSVKSNVILANESNIGSNFNNINNLF
jgi:hypothetical protein